MATIEGNRVIYDTLAAKYGDAKLRLIVCKQWYQHAKLNRDDTGIEFDNRPAIYHKAKQIEQEAVESLKTLEMAMVEVANELADQLLAVPQVLEQYLQK